MEINNEVILKHRSANTKAKFHPNEGGNIGGGGGKGGKKERGEAEEIHISEATNPSLRVWLPSQFIALRLHSGMFSQTALV